MLLRTAGEQTYTYVTNHLGHVTGGYNQNGVKVESHHYSLYGTASGDAFSQQPFGFSTKRNDFTSGLVYFGYRFYVPHLGRWLNRDPLQEAGGINLYAYVNGDPLGYVDPDGRNPFVGGAIAGGAIAGPPGAVVGGLIGAGIGIALCVATDLCNFNESADDGESAELDRKKNGKKAESDFWCGTKPFRGKTRTNGKKGRKARYYEWDHTHDDIEEYDKNGKHLGSIDPETGETYKPPVPGREIDI